MISYRTKQFTQFSLFLLFARAPLTTLSVAVLAALTALLPAAAYAVDYEAKTSGDWSNARTWRPRGVPGAGDRITNLGRHTITLAGAAVIGNGASEPVLSLAGAGALVFAAGAQLTVQGHVRLSGDGALVTLGQNAKLLFAPTKDQVLQLQLFGPNQRIQFAGVSGARAELAQADGTAGHWFVASQGHRDSLLAGAYGRICGALEPESGKAWTMYLANSPTHSRLIARQIEFINSGQVGILGLDAGEHTTVNISGWTFRASHPSAAGVPALWFDGYGDVVAEPQLAKGAGSPQVVKRIRDLVSDKEVYVRYVQGYSLENWVLGANGKPGSVRAGNNGGNALLQKDLFQVVRDSGGVGLVAARTENVYMYSETDNPHGFDTRHLRGDALLRNFWFESHFPKQSDTGDAILTNGPQSWVAEHGGKPVTLTVEHSASIGDTSAQPRHPVFLTVNNGTGMRFKLRHNFMRQPIRFNSVALDENGETATGTGLEFARNLVYSPTPVEGYALGSAAGPRVKQRDVFVGVDHNLYFNLRQRAGDYPAPPHALTMSGKADEHSRTVDPQLRDTTRSLASWDKLLGGPGSAAHAITELQKFNDDAGFNPAYRLSGLLAFVRAGFRPENPLLLDATGQPLVGPAILPAGSRLPGEGLD